jgi:hypothetical protein
MGGAEFTGSMLTPYFIHMKSWLILAAERSHHLNGAYNNRYLRKRNLGRADISQSLYIEDPGDGQLATLGISAIDPGRFADGRSHFFSYTDFLFRVKWLVTHMRRYHFIFHNGKRFPLWLQAEGEKLERVIAI